MATACFIRKPNQGSWILGWDLASGETGDPTPFIGHLSDKSVQMWGDFNGSSVSLVGLIDPAETEYSPLRALTGDPITAITAEYFEVIQQNPGRIQPVALTITAVKIRIICTAARSRAL